MIGFPHSEGSARQGRPIAGRMPEYTFESPKYPEVEVQLTGEDGNAFAILARVDRALRRAGVSREERQAVRAQAVDGDYDHLLWFVSRMVWVS